MAFSALMMTVSESGSALSQGLDPGRLYPARGGGVPVTQATYSSGETVAVGAGGALFLGPLLMIVFRQKYPRWWFGWNLELGRFSSRVSVYLALMDDRYPSTDDHQVSPPGLPLS